MGSYAFREPNMKPFSQACENNKRPILEQLKPLLTPANSVLEIGTGTGQHAVFFSQQMPHLSWQTSDLKENHEGINLWLEEAEKNCLPPLELDVFENHWPTQKYDAIYSANTSHIMPWEGVVEVFKALPRLLNPGGVYAIYGPFNYNGQYTSDSNASFDLWLKERAPHQGIRDFEQLLELGKLNQLTHLHDFEMPANNRLLVWQKNGQ